jgi:RNA polymerase sigma-70 factor (ECF subfamily)
MPPRQRAVLMLRDVLGFSAHEVAGMLETTTASVNSALLRARESVQARGGAGERERAPLPHSAAERALVDRFARAFEGGDIDSVIELLSADAWLTMPSEPYEFQGADAIAEFLRRVPRLEQAPYRLVPTRANTQPAFGCYRAEAQTGLLRAHGLLVLTLAGERISTLTRFLDSGVLPHFGLPRSLPR